MCIYYNDKFWVIILGVEDGGKKINKSKDRNQMDRMLDGFIQM